jgi:hypothetical protein
VLCGRNETILCREWPRVPVAILANGKFSRRIMFNDSRSFSLMFSMLVAKSQRRSSRYGSQLIARGGHE